MLRMWGVLSLVILVCTSHQSATAGKRSQIRMVRAHVRFFATSSSVHSSWGGSEDIYLAEIEFDGRAKETGLAWLVDEYPPYRVSIPAAILTSTSMTPFRLRRDRGCDVAYGLMSLRTPPGDPMAILPEHLSFQPVLPEQITATDVIPCYRLLRH